MTPRCASAAPAQEADRCAATGHCPLALSGTGGENRPMTDAPHLTLAELEAGLDEIRRAPKDAGTLAMIVRRPGVDQREVVEEAQLDLQEGLVGDNWRARGNRSTADKAAHPEMQLNVMNARCIALLATRRERWALAGDQLFVDFDLSEENLPVGSRLVIGAAVIEVTAPPHTGCSKFMARYGAAAVKFVNSPVGRGLHLRGINAKIVTPGVIRTGDAVRKL
jgi:MOSC domain-containing protein YiiM